ncbi:MAG: hypothetical protein ACJAZ8_001721 [Planctomycetota bacterium]|jgi:hypothetical protein
MTHPLLALLADESTFDWTQSSVYFLCFVAGGTVVVLQSVLMLFGFGGMDDLDGLEDGGMELEGSESAFGFLSVRAVSAFFTMFGLSGWGATEAGWSTPATIGISLACGVGIMLVVVYILSLQKNLYSEGNLRPEKIVGDTAKVYLRIPAGGKGRGKITVSIQGRSEQYDARTAATAEHEIPTGGQVQIIRMITPGSFEVKAL